MCGWAGCNLVQEPQAVPNELSFCTDVGCLKWENENAPRGWCSIDMMLISPSFKMRHSTHDARHRIIRAQRGTGDLPPAWDAGWSNGEASKEIEDGVEG